MRPTRRCARFKRGNWRATWRSILKPSAKSVEAAVKAAKGQPVEKQISTGETLVTKENAGEFVK